MNAIAVVIILLAVVTAFVYGVARSLLRIWMDHRLKLALLEKYEAHPELFQSSEEVLGALAQHESAARASVKQDYALTGILVAALGLASLSCGWVMGVGKLAVGLYVGGIICVILGVLIALLGFLIRALSRATIAEAVHAPSD